MKTTVGEPELTGGWALAIDSETWMCRECRETAEYCALCHGFTHAANEDPPDWCPHCGAAGADMLAVPDDARDTYAPLRAFLCPSPWAMDAPPCFVVAQDAVHARALLALARPLRMYEAVALVDLGELPVWERAGVFRREASPASERTAESARCVTCGAVTPDPHAAGWCACDVETWRCPGCAAFAEGASRED
jgi:hypothetical protein